MSFLKKKKILITGISNTYSIAFGIAKVLYREGAELAFTYQNNRLEKRVKKISSFFKSDIILPCDVQEDDSINQMFNNLSKKWTSFDGFIHSIAYAPNNQFRGNYVNVTNRESFTIAHNISSYSFLALAKASQNFLSNKSSLVTLTYVGSKYVVPNYNVMGLAKASLEANVRYMADDLGPKGIRVNAISSGPIKTISSSSIRNFRSILSYVRSVSPIRRLVNTEEIGNVVAFLCSDLSSGITGEVIYVDGGFNISFIRLV